MTHDRAHGFLAAVAVLGVDDQRATYSAGRATLCAGPDDLNRYDQVFEAYFSARDGLPRPRPAASLDARRSPDSRTTQGDGDGEAADDESLRAMASATEVLRHRDVAALTARRRSSGSRRCSRTLAATTAAAPTARHQPWHRGDVDASRTLRASLRRMGEPADIAWRRRGTRPRRVVLLVDVSGSMSGYADALLRLAHRFTQAVRPSGARASRRSPSAPD